MLLHKGNSDEWVIERCVKDINALGWSDLVIKCDQELAIVALQNFIVESRKTISDAGTKTLVENSPTYEHQSNGSVENGVKEVKGLFRTFKDSL